MNTDSKIRPAPQAIEHIWLAVNMLDEDRRPVVLTNLDEAEMRAERDYWTVVGPYAPVASSTDAHVFNGLCPEPAQPDSRDPGCPACRALTPGQMQRSGEGPTDA